MARVKRGVTARRRHKKILSRAKGDCDQPTVRQKPMGT